MIMMCVTFISLEAQKRNITDSDENSKYYGFLALIFGILISISI